MDTKTKIPVDEIKEGDKFVREDGVVYWTALDDSDLTQHPQAKDPLIHVRVQFVDGGTEDRFWDPGTMLEVQRG